MKFKFDIRGNLKPYQKNKVNLEFLKQGFVDPFDENSTRKKLYEGFIAYNKDLMSMLDDRNYIQWIDGSFISTKINPKDIDLVSFIDHQLTVEYEEELKGFIKNEGIEKYGVDGHILKIYPGNHPKYVRTKSDIVYWEHWFSMSKQNRKKKRFPKGFIELAF